MYRYQFYTLITYLRASEFVLGSRLKEVREMLQRVGRGVLVRFHPFHTHSFFTPNIVLVTGVPFRYWSSYSRR